MFPISRPKIGLVLGAGGAKGLAHVGVIKALVEHNIPVDMVVGSSMGALVGAFFATGMRPLYMEQLARTLRMRNWLDVQAARTGLASGERVWYMVQLLTRSRSIEHADLPLAIVATDLLERRLEVFRTGSIADAVRASVSIPGVFVPFERNGHIYVDGGVIERVPVEVARLMGAEAVIAVDVISSNPTQRPDTIMDVVMMALDIMQQDTVTARAANANVWIQPDLSGVASSHFHKAGHAINAGYRSTLAVMETIENCVKSQPL